MDISVPKSYWRVFNIVFCASALLLLAFYAVVLVPLNHLWLSGDWLINYQGGFVRRGLVGEILFETSSLTGINLGILAIVLQMSLYAIFIMNTLFLSVNSSFTPLNAMLICSPAFILFPILDPDGGFRKEVLLIAPLAVLCNRLADPRARVPKYLPACMGVLCVVVVLSHEMLLVYLPYLICVFLIHDKGPSAQAKRAALWLIPAVIAALLIIVFGRGSQPVVADICNSLKTSAPQDCFSSNVVGAITFLAKDMKFAHDYVLASNPPSTLIVYAISVVLAFIPLALKYRSKQFTGLYDHKTRFWLAVSTCTALTASLSLLWFVADYGRIIYIHVACLSLLMLMATRESDDKPLRLRLNLMQAGAWLFYLLFVVGWRLAHWEATPQNAFPFYTFINRFFTR